MSAEVDPYPAGVVEWQQGQIVLLLLRSELQWEFVPLKWPAEMHVKKQILQAPKFSVGLLQSKIVWSWRAPKRFSQKLRRSSLFSIIRKLRPYMERHDKIQNKHDRNKIRCFNIVYQWQRCLIMFSPLCHPKKQNTYRTYRLAWCSQATWIPLLIVVMGAKQLPAGQLPGDKTRDPPHGPTFFFSILVFGSRNVGFDHAHQEHRSYTSFTWLVWLQLYGGGPNFKEISETSKKI